MIQLIGDIVEGNGKTIRENNTSHRHNIPIGTLVEIQHGEFATDMEFCRLYVCQHTRDCDGTPLYSLGPYGKEKHINLKNIFSLVHIFNGYAENDLIVIKQDNIMKGDEG